MPPRVTFTAISASLALDSTGQAWAWGDNSFGELGNGTTTSSSVPVPVSMPAGVTFTAISAGALYSLALDSTAVDTAAYGERRDYLYELPGGGGETIWLIENELGSWTVMFSSDY
jgi:hypothetical protein